MKREIFSMKRKNGTEMLVLLVRRTIFGFSVR